MSCYFLQLMFDYMITTDEIRQFQIQSTGICNYQFEDFLDFQPFILPSKDCLDAFDKIIAPMYQKIGIMGSVIEVLKQTRDKLLPRLLSGAMTV